MAATRNIVLTALAVAAALALTGCVDSAPLPASSHTASSIPTAPATPEPDPEFFPEGTALQNLPYFDFVNKQLLASNGEPDGRTIIDNLVAAGFDKATMEVTPDRTAVDLQADSILFSIKIADKCLVGQIGSGVGYRSLTVDPIGTGTCLVGQTRPIDW